MYMIDRRKSIMVLKPIVLNDWFMCAMWLLWLSKYRPGPLFPSTRGKILLPVQQSKLITSCFLLKVTTFHSD